MIFAAICFIFNNRPGHFFCSGPSPYFYPPIRQIMPTNVLHPEHFDPPRAPKKPQTLISPSGDIRIDPYYWLCERNNPEVIEYLEAENRYADAVLAPVAGLQQQLFDEMMARIQQDDNSAPYFKNGFWYYIRYESGREYPVYCRKKDFSGSPEQILLDVNALARGHSYCLATGLNVSPDNRLLFYAVDFSGRHLFQGRVKDLETGQLLADRFQGVLAGSSAWAADSRHLFYETKDPDTLRTDKIRRHTIGSGKAADKLVYQETDETLYLFLAKSRSEQFIFLHHGYTDNLETRFLDASQPFGTFQVIRPRQKGVFYTVDHHGDQFLIRTNWNARNFRLMTAPVRRPEQDNWSEVLPHRPDVLLEGIEAFKDYLVAVERKCGLIQLRIIHWADKSGYYLDFGEPAYSAAPDVNAEYDSKIFRYRFTSLKTPASVFDYNMETRQRTLCKTDPVLGGFDANCYETELLWAKARDGAGVPVSAVYKKGHRRDGSAPCLLTAYGAYGFPFDPAFNREVISLLDRGFVYAIAHVRGGAELGYHWYDQGKMLHKMNTFTDFIDCANMLCRLRYTSTGRLFATGRSAGGLLMGAVANMAPDHFKGIIAGVPFVDVLTTMGDPAIPLTTGEYSEWGNPAVDAEYEYMKQYSPYDNLSARDYPHLLVLTAFNDSQVQYFEPAKWVARLRDLKTDRHILLFITSMNGAHGGSSGRFERLRERALEYAWMLALLDMEAVP